MTDSLLPRTLSAAAALGVLLVAGSWLLAQPDDPRRHSNDPPRSVTDDAFSGNDRSDRGDRRPPSPRERFEGMGERFDEVLLVLDDIDPAMAQRIRNLPEQRPGLRMMAIQRRFPEALRLVELRRDDPELYALRIRDLVLYRRSLTLAREIDAAQRLDPDSDAADDLTDTLEDTIEEHFDVQQDLRELELDRFEAKLDQLKDEHKERDRNKRDLIDQRLQELLNQPPPVEGRDGLRGPRGPRDDDPRRGDRLRQRGERHGGDNTPDQR